MYKIKTEAESKEYFIKTLKRTHKETSQGSEVKSHHALVTLT
jgi:hypothetical protein